MTNKDIVKNDQDNQLSFTRDQIDLIKKTIAVGATDDELKLFLYQARRTGLDPLNRQIYFVKRGEKAVMQTSIDGFRVIAERSNKYAGQDNPIFEEGENGTPRKCTVNIYRFGPDSQRYLAAVGVAYWKEYCPEAGKDFMWKKMPHTMLEKVAEAKALRKAFPQDLSGLYTDEEMDQAAAGPQETHNSTNNEPIKKSVEYQCVECSRSITEAVYNYSTENMGQALCMSCQRVVKESEEIRE